MFVRKLLTGDTIKAARYLPFGMRFLKRLKRLKVASSVISLANGVEIHAKQNNHDAMVRIHATSGNLFVADSSNSRWKDVSRQPLGSRAKAYGSFGTGEGEFDGFAFGIATMGQKIYVTNTSLGAVDIYSLKGVFELRVLVSAFPVYHLAAAEGMIAVVASVGGSLPSNDTVLIFDASFNLITSFTAIANYYVGAIAIYKGRLYVSTGAYDSGDDIKVYDIASGDYLWGYSGVILCEGMAIYNEELYVTDPSGGDSASGHYVYVFPANESGPVTRSFGTKGPNEGAELGLPESFAGVGEFEYYGGGARGIAVNRSGVYVSDVNSGVPIEEFRFRDSINKFSHSGVPLAKHVGYGAGINQYNQPFGLAIKE